MAPRRVAEPVAGTERPAARRGPALLVLGLGCVLAAALWAGRDELASHRARWFGAPGARVTMRYAALSPAMDEAALRRHFAGLPLRCDDAGAGLRRCAADLAQADGMTAARLQAELRDGRLTALEVSLPWWEHHSAARQLVAGLGAPAAFDGPTMAPEQGGFLWELPGARLRMPRHPGWNPWRWTRLRWAAIAAAP